MYPIKRAKRPGLNKFNIQLFHMHNRRAFLRISGLAAAALASGKLLSASPLSVALSSTNKFGIQLYTLRDILPGNARSILKELASYGYTQIESYEGPEGIYWGMSAKECQQYLNSLGMQMTSTHCDIHVDFEKKAADAASIEMKYLICPWVGPQQSIQDFKKIAADFNAKGKICKKNGIRFAYHNHDYSFKMIDNQLPQEVLLQETDPELVDFELDMYWVKAAGGDPLDWFKRFPGRFRLAHVKDRNKLPTQTGEFETTDLGAGSMDYASLLPQAKKMGITYFIVEQEHYPNGSPLVAAKTGANFMKKIKL